MNAPHSVTGAQASAAEASPTNALAGLLQYEADLRRQGTVNELCYFIANESRPVVPYDQMFLFSQKLVGDRLKLVCASSLATVDRQAPLIQAIEARIAAIDPVIAQPVSFGARDVDDPLAAYPFVHALWQPMLDTAGKCFGGMLTTHAAPPPTDSAARLARIAETAAHAWRALTGDRPVRRMRALGAREKRGLWVLVAVAAFFPIRLSVLAPFEVVAERPFVIAAPYDGVIDRIHAPPNAPVRRNQLVLTLEDMQVRGQMQEAQERLRVAEARIERATSAAFADADEAAGLATLRAEQDVASAELSQLREVMQRTQLRAPRGGMLLYSDRRDWEGRAVRVGEPILQIANPRAVVVRVDLPAREQIELSEGGGARLWLDAQPLWARDGSIISASYQARTTADGVLSFAVIVRPAGGVPRIGSRGTAKLYGAWVPLSYAILRRPLSAMRQYIGI